MQKNNDDSKELIHKLILQEEEEAFRHFDKRKFNSRIEAQINTVSKRGHFFPFWNKKVVQIFGIVLIIVCAGIIYIVSKISFHQKKWELLGIELFLQNSSAIQRVIERPKETNLVFLNAKKIPSQLEEELEKTFFRSKEERLSERKDISLIKDENTPELGLGEKIEILIWKKSLHQFLSKYKENSEE